MENEFVILHFIQDHVRNDFFDVLMPIISGLIMYGIPWVIIALICLVIKKYRILGRSLIISLVVNLVIIFVVKKLVGRIRPFVLNSNISLIVNPETSGSFPSGHTWFSFSAATVIFMYNKKLGMAAYIYALTVAFSRLYLYVHFPTDIIFGAFFGIIFGIAVYKIEQIAFENKRTDIRIIK